MLLPKEMESREQKINLALDGIKQRLQYLQDVGLGYLTLDRSTKTLSGGETQRVNLTTCLGSSLTDAMFALDEPTIGLHGKDVGNLIKILRKLADAGNCVCVVEHDENVIRAADKIIEIGPKPGSMGGEVVFEGNLKNLLTSKHSLTGKWLSKKVNEGLKANSSKMRPATSGQIKVHNASMHNLNKFCTKIPLAI